MGKQSRLSRKHAVYTGRSGTTTMVNYDASTQVLEVEFIEGDIYHYLKVPKAIWEELVQLIRSGGSSGTFVNKIIKPHYKFKKVLQ